MASHRLTPSKSVTNPPRIKLIIAGFISAYGVLSSVDTDMQPPWTGTGYNLAPRTCDFKGQFLFAPGMDKDGNIVIVTNNNSLSMDSVGSNFYNTETPPIISDGGGNAANNTA
jgi:hypothetical protein